ncbi:hypothetical protein EON65_08320 [archaeon]|nr:MAG: hypothetical protein EON65_08320 [archaeon]
MLYSGTGFLVNVEDRDCLSHESLLIHKIYQGGHYRDLHRMLSVPWGERILYVGDHMYADVLSSKRMLRWRTCLIIPELDHELLVARKEQDLASELTRLRKYQLRCDEHIDQLRWKEMAGVDVAEELMQSEQLAEKLKTHLQAVNEEYNQK